MMCGPKPVPTRPAEISPRWITDVLTKSDGPRHGRCIGVRAETIGADRGFTGVIARLFLTYDEAGRHEGAPSTLIAKLPTAERPVPAGYQARQQHDPAARRLAFDRARREISFYRQIAPLSPLRTPRLYAAREDETSGTLVALIEDIADAEPGDALTGCGVDDARLALLALAQFHARWWTNPPSSAAGWLPLALADPAARQARYDHNADRLLGRFPELLPSPVIDLIQRLRSRYADVVAGLQRTPTTVIHADFHLDNVLFTTGGPARIPVVIDWQTVSLGPAVLDIAPFVATSLPVPERRTHETGQLRAYHAALIAGGTCDYDWDRFLADYRAALLVQLAGTVGWLANADFSQMSNRERALTEAAFGDGRLIAALQDHKVIQSFV